MTKREVVRVALQHKRPPYVPWSYWFTAEVVEKLHRHLHCTDLAHIIENHMTSYGVGSSTPIGPKRRRDHMGIEYDCSGEGEIGVVCNRVLPEPTLAGFKLPEPEDPQGIVEGLKQFPDRFRICGSAGVYSTACSLRGMENLMMDFYDHPDFVHALFRKLGDYGIGLIERAVKYEIDAIHFGDDWGQQIGLQIGKPLWMEFVYPEYKRMFKVVKDAGLFVSIHSCGDVDELFDELIGIGLDVFNPFQPEVMDVPALMRRYRGRLSFHGGLSTQRTLPYGKPDDVRRETRQLLELGQFGGYIFAPAHGVPEDVPPENVMAFVEVLQDQPGYRKH